MRFPLYPALLLSATIMATGLVPHLTTLNLFNIPVAHAVAPAPPPGGAATGGFKGGFDAVEAARAAAGVKDFGTLGNFIVAVLAVIAALVAVLALAALVWGAVMYITSLGDESRVERAKKIIIYALIGLLVLGIAGIVVNVVINLIRD